MRPLSDFVPDVISRGAYTAPPNLVEDAIRRTAIDLCEAAGVWTHDFTFYTQDNVADYPIDTPLNTRVVCMTRVRIGNTWYEPAPNTNLCACGPYAVSMPDPKTIILAPVPWPGCEELSCTVKLWLAPLQEICELPDVLWEEYSDTLAWGASARMLMMPKQDYTNAGLSQKHLGLYIAGKTQAKNKYSMQRTRGPLLMRGSYF